MRISTSEICILLLYCLVAWLCIGYEISGHFFPRNLNVPLHCLLDSNDAIAKSYTIIAQPLVFIVFNLQTLLVFHYFSHQCYFFGGGGSGSNTEFHIISTCHVSFVSYNRWQFLGFSLRLMTLTPLKSIGQLFCRISLSLGLSYVFSWLSLCIFGKIPQKGY